MAEHAQSIKHAVAIAATLAERVGYPRARVDSWCSTCHAPPTDDCREMYHALIYRRREGEFASEMLPYAVRASMRAAGVDPDGPDARLLYEWATTTDPEHPEALRAQAAAKRAEADDLPARSHDRRRALEDAAALDRAALDAARVIVLVDRLFGQFEIDGIVRRPPKPKAMAVAYRVVELDGRRSRRCVVLDETPAEAEERRDELAAQGLYLGREGAARASGIVSGAVEGEVTAEARDPGQDARRPDLRAELLPRWLAGEVTIPELDELLAERIGCSLRTAGRERSRWGVVGSRGRDRTVSEHT